jgi:hypothetical protein
VAFALACIIRTVGEELEVRSQESGVRRRISNLGGGYRNFLDIRLLAKVLNPSIQNPKSKIQN